MNTEFRAAFTEIWAAMELLALIGGARKPLTYLVVILIPDFLLLLDSERQAYRYSTSRQVMQASQASNP